MGLSRKKLWLAWGLLTMLGAAVLTTAMLSPEAVSHPVLAATRTVFLPGGTTSGHRQIELACTTCHTSPFGGREVLQEACVGCHGQALKDADDKHPKSKFTDPRNAARTSKLDATQCVSCHVEHRPAITTAMSVTQPLDFCAHCHGGVNDIAEERPSHQGMGFETCGTAGCHNYHDNRALYEDYLAKRLDEPAHRIKAWLPARNFGEFLLETPDHPAAAHGMEALALSAADAPPAQQGDARVMNDWFTTAHAAAGVNCSGCHASSQHAWVTRPKQEVCASCHAAETKGFHSGKHGMRLAVGLSPLTPAMAELPMKAEARDTELTCTTCHGAHRFDTRRAAVEVCLGCHDDQHSKAYIDSPHHRLWQREMAGENEPGTGVSCAGCHMPRIEHREAGNTRRLVQHNQSDSLRPVEKMARPVCMNCHGLSFTLNALADPELAARNFRGQPSGGVRSFAMVTERLKEAEARRRARAEAQSE